MDFLWILNAHFFGTKSIYKAAFSVLVAVAHFGGGRNLEVVKRPGMDRTGRREERESV